LLNCRAGNCTGGSNPPPSATPLHAGPPNGGPAFCFYVSAEGACSWGDDHKNKINMRLRRIYAVVLLDPPPGITEGNPQSPQVIPPPPQVFPRTLEVIQTSQRVIT